MANDDQTRLNPTEARAGATPHMTRYILPASLVLVIVAFIVIYYVV